jgi:hypothetical protein
MLIFSDIILQAIGICSQNQTHAADGSSAPRPSKLKIFNGLDHTDFGTLIETNLVD